MCLLLTSKQIINNWEVLKNDPDNPLAYLDTPEEFIRVCRSRGVHCLGGKIVITDGKGEVIQ